MRKAWNDKAGLRSEWTQKQGGGEWGAVPQHIPSPCPPLTDATVLQLHFGGFSWVSLYLLLFRARWISLYFVQRGARRWNISKKNYTLGIVIPFSPPVLSVHTNQDSGLNPKITMFWKPDFSLIQRVYLRVIMWRSLFSTKTL